jgi:peptide-methionine (S)-S-oxide reductase
METNVTHASAVSQTATFGGGCFWCIETIFQDIKGVLRVESGYMGGSTLNPSYKEICSGLTGHAEVIQVTFDPALVSFRTLADVFFTVHDPTTLNRQGNDVGTQYRSVIFWHTPEQQAEALAAKQQAGALWSNSVVTEIAPASTFYKAEPYHQNYYKDNPYQPYCMVVIAPKVKKFREQYREALK